jgi:hypothetical protein
MVLAGGLAGISGKFTGVVFSIESRPFLLKLNLSFALHGAFPHGVTWNGFA